jgi:predicted nuclease of restriction endonuclease-like (RecB) superfamily
MSMAKPKRAQPTYDGVLQGIVELLHAARSTAARTVNSIMTATYWEVGRRIVELEQGGKARAAYGEELTERLGKDLSASLGRGFSARNLRSMRLFYLTWPSSEPPKIGQTPSAKSSTPKFPLPWSHYVTLLGVENDGARAFYEREALAGGWTIRQLKRQVGSQFFERTALSKNKAAMLRKGERREDGDAVSPAEEIKDPMLLEFLDLKDEYSESDLEEALIRHLESFLLELGGDFAFVGRQKRLRLDDVWFRVDLVLYHRRLRCLVIIDLKLDKFTHADVGQMNVYLNYAKRHWTHPGENPPVGLILCASKGEQVAEYALEGIANRMLAADYRTKLPDPKSLEIEMAKQREAFEARRHKALPKMQTPASKRGR